MIAAVTKSIRRKVMLLVLATTVSALALSAVALVVYDLRSYEQQTSNDLISQAEVLARAGAPAIAFGDRKAAEEDLAVMQVRPRILAAAFYTRTGEIFATYARPDRPAADFPAEPGAEGYSIEGGQLQLFKRVEEGGDVLGAVYLLATYDPWARLADYLSILGLVMIASLAAAALLSGWLQSAVTTPILEMARVSREVMERRDFSLRVRKTTEDELGELVDAYNAMLAEVGRRAEELREADRRKDEFLATLAHELRNPLAPLRNALEILRLAGHDPEKSLKAREMMERQLKQMVRLVDDLLDVSRITTGKLGVRKAVIDLHGPISDALETVRSFVHSRGHTLDVQIASEPIPVDGDRTRLAQVFANLLNNAAKYTPVDGHISISASMEPRAAVIRIRDDGIGLSAEAIDRIFDMFVQVDRTLERSQAGLGVGLTLARRLVELHDGTIEVRSEGQGRGSEFIVHLPLSSARLQSAPRQGGAQGSAGHSRRILLADDNVDFATSLGQLLSARGHDVRVVHDGAEALEAAEQFSPEIAFVDIGMPKIHGYEVARRMRAMARTSGCMLVAVTGWGQENDRRRAREAGFDRHMVKPVDPEQIEAIVEGVAASSESP